MEMVDRVRSGLITNRDREWFNGERSGYDQKYALKKGIAQTMLDIDELLNIDYNHISDPPLRTVAELFQRLEEDAGLTREDCARNLISLAFIISNDNIDYSEILKQAEIHPRDEDEGELPRRGRKSIYGGRSWHHPIDDLLVFRNALSSGIRFGKRYIDGQENDIDIPNIVTVDSNTKLYKEPTVNRLKPIFNASDWRDAFAVAIDTGHHPDIDTPESDVLDQDQAIEVAIFELLYTVDHKLALRRHYSDYDTRRYQLD